MDSMADVDLTPETILQIAQIHKPTVPYLEIVREPVQQQHGSDDCGLFAIAFMLEVCQGNDVKAITFHQSKMRKHQLECLEKGIMSSFPRTRKAGIKRSRREQFEEALYCTCLMPDFYDVRMIACDACNKWYHCKCVQVKRGDLWICHHCTQKK